MHIVLVLVALAAAGVSAFLYSSRRADHQDDAVLASNAADIGSPSTALGEFTPLEPPRPAPEVTFAMRDGSPQRISDYRGHWLLINLWATWCAPCVREMPSLDRLQAKLGGRLIVLAISQDRGGEHVVGPFLDHLGIDSLHVYLDSKGAVAQALGARGLPTSFLLDGEGRIRARLEGAAEWDSPAMLATLEHYLGRTNAAGGGKRSAEHG